MSRKEKQYHFLYKTTNLINNKFYYGMHSTNDLNDGYLGSGLKLRRSIQKYGKENFKLKIIKFYLNRIKLIEAEKNLVNESLLQDPLCMNLMKVGEGGFISVEQQKRRSIAGNNAFKEKLKNDKEFAEKFKQKSSANMKKYHQQGKIKYDTFTGKHHTEETKQKIGKTNAIKQTGSGNSNYGKCWIYNLELKQSKSIKKEDLNQFLNKGWIKGRYKNK